MQLRSKSQIRCGKFYFAALPAAASAKVARRNGTTTADHAAVSGRLRRVSAMASARPEAGRELTTNLRHSPGNAKSIVPAFAI